MAAVKTAKGRNASPTASGAPHIDRSYEVLVALRRIIRAADLHSKKTLKVSGLTIPQIVVLQSVRELGEVTTGQISKRVDLSQSTVTTILDRLEKRGLIERYRSNEDRRVVHTKLTQRGGAALNTAPSLLHEQFVERFSNLSPARQNRIVSTLDKVAELLGAENLDAAPLLDTGSPLSPGEAKGS